MGIIFDDSIEENSFSDLKTVAVKVKKFGLRAILDSSLNSNQITKVCNDLASLGEKIQQLFLEIHTKSYEPKPVAKLIESCQYLLELGVNLNISASEEDVKPLAVAMSNLKLL